MLTPEYLEGLPEEILKLYQKAEEEILADMARKIASYDYWMPATDWQYRKLREAGQVSEEILRVLSQKTGKTRAELRKLMQQAVKTSLRLDESIYRAVGVTGEPLASSEALRNILNTGYRATMQTMLNLTRTTARTASQQFERALDKAWMKVTSGAFSTDAAVKGAVKELSEKGLESIEYPSGRRDTLEVAVRRAVVTGVNQTCGQIQLERAKQMGADLMELTAHEGARPTHAEWQGQIVSLSGQPGYLSLEDIGYGTVTGFKGANCRHDWNPWFEGMPRTWTPEALAKLNEPKYEYKGEKLTQYEASQIQRYNERQIRRWKREYTAMKAAGQETTEASAKLAEWNKRQDDFLKQTGFKRRQSREEIEGFSWRNQKAASEEAIARNKMLSEFRGKMEDAGYQLEGFDTYYGDRATLEHMSSSMERMSQLYPEEAKGVTVRWGYHKDDTTYGWYDPRDGSISFNKNALGKWNKVEKEYEGLVGSRYFPAGTNADSIFIHEFGHRVWHAHGGGSLGKAVKSIFEQLGYGYISSKQQMLELPIVLSGYAAKTTVPAFQEAIAEAFSEYYNSLTAREFCKRLLKEVGLI